MANPTNSRRAERIRQIRERQRAIGGGGGGGGGCSVAGSVASSTGAASSGGASSVNSGGGNNEEQQHSSNANMGLSMTQSMVSEGDASSVASSSHRLTKAQRAAKYRARKMAKPSSNAGAASTTGNKPAAHPPHPPASIPIPKKSSTSESSRVPANGRPGAASPVQIESVLSSASDVMSTASSFTTSSQMTAKAANTLSFVTAKQQQHSRGRGRAASAPRAGRSPVRSVGGGKGGGSRAASLRKLRAESPSILRRVSSHGGCANQGGGGTKSGPPATKSRSQSVSSRSSRSQSVEKVRAASPPTTPVDTVQVNTTAALSPSATSDIDSCVSPASPVSTCSSKSEHLSVEKGLRLIQKMHNAPAIPLPSPRRTPSPSPCRSKDRSMSLGSNCSRGSISAAVDERERQQNRARDPEVGRDGDAAQRRESSSSRPDPPRDASPTQSESGKGGSAWDRAQRAVQAQMDATQEILATSPSDERAATRHVMEPPMEPEEVEEQSPAPAPAPAAARAPAPAPAPVQDVHYPEEEAADTLSPQSQREQDEARVLAEQEIRQLEARASEMKRQMERQAEILERQEMEMVKNERQLHSASSALSLSAMSNQDHLPPHVPPSPQFLRLDHQVSSPPSPQFSQPEQQQQQQQQWQRGSPGQQSQFQQQQNDHFNSTSSGTPPMPSSPYPQVQSHLPPPTPPSTSNVSYGPSASLSQGVAQVPPLEQPHGVPGSSSPMMQQRAIPSGWGVTPASSAPPSPSVHSHSPYSPHHLRQHDMPPAQQVNAMGQQYSAPPQQDQSPHYQQKQETLQIAQHPYQPEVALGHYQSDASLEQKYRQYTLSPPSQGAPTPPGPVTAQGMPAADAPYHHEPLATGPQSQYQQQQYSPAQDNNNYASPHHGHQANQPVAHMHYESHTQDFTCEEANMPFGMKSSRQQQMRGTIQSLAIDPHMQQYPYGGTAGQREGSEANKSTESSFEASSISHLTASTLGTASHHQQRAARKDPPAFSGQARGDPPEDRANDFPSPDEEDFFAKEQKKTVAPLLSPENLKSPRVMGFESDSGSIFDDPTFSPQSAQNKSNCPSVTSKAISESGASWWKEPYPDSQGGGGNSPVEAKAKAQAPAEAEAQDETKTEECKAKLKEKHDKIEALTLASSPQSQAHFQAQTLGTVEESRLGGAAFLASSPAAKSLPSRMMPSSPAQHSTRSTSQAMNSVASGQASHFTTRSATTADSLGKRLATKLNIKSDDDEDIFSGIEDSGTDSFSKSTDQKAVPAKLGGEDLLNDDIFDGVSSPIASPAARTVESEGSKMSAGGLSKTTSKVSAAAFSKTSAADLSKTSASGLSKSSRTSAGLNTVDGPKALMDDATSFMGTASMMGASKRSASNLDASSGQNQTSLNLEYSNSTRETTEKIFDDTNNQNKNNHVGDFATALNEPRPDGVLGMENTGAQAMVPTGLNEPTPDGVLGMENTGANAMVPVPKDTNQFVMEMGNKDILEFATHPEMGDAGTITSDITSSIIDMGPTAKKEAYGAYASVPPSKYGPKSSPIIEADESRSRASTTERSTTRSAAKKHVEGENVDKVKKPREPSTFSDADSEYDDDNTFDRDANTLDNTLDDTLDDTLDNTLDTTRSRRGRKGSSKKNKRGENYRSRGRKSSRKRYDGSDDSYSDDYDDITRGGSTVMTSASRDSTASDRSGRIDFLSRYGCGVLDAIAMNCGGQGPPPTSFDDRSLDADEIYNEEEAGESFDRTVDNSTLNGTVAGAERGNDLSAQEQKVWDAWDKKDSETMAGNASQSVASKSMGTAARLEELELRQRRAQHLERRARAHEKLLLHAYSAMSLPPPPPGVEKGDETASITPTSNNSSNAENKEPDDETRGSFTTRGNEKEEESLPYSTGTREIPSPLKPQSPMQIKPKPPSAPTGSKILAAKSAILQRQTLEKFSARLKNQGMEVLKMNHNKKWQDRVLTVSKEVTLLSQDKDSIFSGDRGHCPQGLLWAKKFHTKTREHSVSDIDKTGKGGMFLHNLQGASLGNVADYPLAKKQLQGRFKDSVVVVLHSAEEGYPGNIRDVVLRCKSMEEATFLCSGCKAIAEILHRDAEAKVLAAQKGKTSFPALGSPNAQVLSPNGAVNSGGWEM